MGLLRLRRAVWHLPQGRQAPRAFLRSMGTPASMAAGGSEATCSGGFSGRSLGSGTGFDTAPTANLSSGLIGGGWPGSGSVLSAICGLRGDGGGPPSLFLEVTDLAVAALAETGLCDVPFARMELSRRVSEFCDGLAEDCQWITRGSRRSPRNRHCQDSHQEGGRDPSGHSASSRAQPPPERPDVATLRAP